MKINTFRRGVISGIVALLLVGITIPTPRVQAATLAELQAQIQSLLVQITALQNQLLAMQGGLAVCPAPFSNLTLGNRGNEVIKLQNFLISRGYAIPAGATGYFGEQTRTALQRFQANQGIGPALGYNYGPLTRARVQALCTVPTPTPTPQPQPEPEPPLSGEASLERFTVNDGNDTDLEEGNEDAEIMEISFRVRDGDAELNRLEIGFSPDIDNDENDPWDTFTKVSVWDGDSRLATVDADDRDEWREDSPQDGDYTLRLSGLDLLMKEDREINLTVTVDVQDNVRGTDDSESWTVFIPDDGLRALDADNAPLYTGDTADSVTLNLDRAGASDELIVRRSNEDRDASVLQLDDNRNSGYVKVFAFDLDTDDSRNDIEIRELPIQLTFSNGSLDTFIRSAQLIIDGETYTDETITGGSTGFITFDFDRNDLVIDAGDRVTAILEIDFEALDEVYEGTTLVAHIDADDIEAEGSDDLTGNQLQSAATGEVHTLYSKGSAVGSESASAVVTSVDGANNDYATFSLTVNLSAFGQDVYIPFGTNGVTYQLQDAVGNALGTSGTAVVTSSADEVGNYFHITEGSSETITLDVTYMPGIPNTVARMQLISINFNDTASSPDQTWMALPASSYRTPARVIVN